MGRFRGHRGNRDVEQTAKGAQSVSDQKIYIVVKGKCLTRVKRQKNI